VIGFWGWQRGNVLVTLLRWGVWAGKSAKMIRRRGTLQRREEGVNRGRRLVWHVAQPASAVSSGTRLPKPPQPGRLCHTLSLAPQAATAGAAVPHTFSRLPKPPQPGRVCHTLSLVPQSRHSRGGCATHFDSFPRPPQPGRVCHTLSFVSQTATAGACALRRLTSRARFGMLIRVTRAGFSQEFVRWA